MNESETDEGKRSILKMRARFPLQEVPCFFPDDDTVTFTRSRRVSFGKNLVKEFIKGSAASTQALHEYEQSSESISEPSDCSGPLDLALNKTCASVDMELESPAPRQSLSGQTEDPEQRVRRFTEGCISLAKTVFDQAESEMTAIIINAKPAAAEEERRNISSFSITNLDISTCGQGIQFSPKSVSTLEHLRKETDFVPMQHQELFITNSCPDDSMDETFTNINQYDMEETEGRGMRCIPRQGSQSDMEETMGRGIMRQGSQSDMEETVGRGILRNATRYGSQSDMEETLARARSTPRLNDDKNTGRRFVQTPRCGSQSDMEMTLARVRNGTVLSEVQECSGHRLAQTTRYGSQSDMEVTLARVRNGTVLSEVQESSGHRLAQTTRYGSQSDMEVTLARVRNGTVLSEVQESSEHRLAQNTRYGSQSDMEETLAQAFQQARSLDDMEETMGRPLMKTVPVGSNRDALSTNTVTDPFAESQFCNVSFLSSPDHKTDAEKAEFPHDGELSVLDNKKTDLDIELDGARDDFLLELSSMENTSQRVNKSMNLSRLEASRKNGSVHSESIKLSLLPEPFDVPPCPPPENFSDDYDMELTESRPLSDPEVEHRIEFVSTSDVRKSMHSPFDEIDPLKDDMTNAVENVLEASTNKVNLHFVSLAQDVTMADDDDDPTAVEGKDLSDFLTKDMDPLEVTSVDNATLDGGWEQPRLSVGANIIVNKQIITTDLIRHVQDTDDIDADGHLGCDISSQKTAELPIAEVQVQMEDDEGMHSSLITDVLQVSSMTNGNHNLEDSVHSEDKEKADVPSCQPDRNSLQVIATLEAGTARELVSQDDQYTAPIAVPISEIPMEQPTDDVVSLKDIENKLTHGDDLDVESISGNVETIPINAATVADTNITELNEQGEISKDHEQIAQKSGPNVSLVAAESERTVENNFASDPMEDNTSNNDPIQNYSCVNTSVSAPAISIDGRNLDEECISGLVDARTHVLSGTSASDDPAAHIVTSQRPPFIECVNEVEKSLTVNNTEPSGSEPVLADDRRQTYCIPPPTTEDIHGSPISDGVNDLRRQTYCVTTNTTESDGSKPVLDGDRRQTYCVVSPTSEDVHRSPISDGVNDFERRQTYCVTTNITDSDGSKPVMADDRRQTYCVVPPTTEDTNGSPICDSVNDDARRQTYCITTNGPERDESKLVQNNDRRQTYCVTSVTFESDATPDVPKTPGNESTFTVSGKRCLDSPCVGEALRKVRRSASPVVNKEIETAKRVMESPCVGENQLKKSRPSNSPVGPLRDVTLESKVAALVLGKTLDDDDFLSRSSENYEDLDEMALSLVDISVTSGATPKRLSEVSNVSRMRMSATRSLLMMSEPKDGDDAEQEQQSSEEPELDTMAELSEENGVLKLNDTLSCDNNTEPKGENYENTSEGCTPSPQKKEDENHVEIENFEKQGAVRSECNGGTELREDSCNDACKGNAMEEKINLPDQITSVNHMQSVSRLSNRLQEDRDTEQLIEQSEEIFENNNTLAMNESSILREHSGVCTTSEERDIELPSELIETDLDKNNTLSISERGTPTELLNVQTTSEEIDDISRRLSKRLSLQNSEVLDCVSKQVNPETVSVQPTLESQVAIEIEFSWLKKTEKKSDKKPTKKSCSSPEPPLDVQVYQKLDEQMREEDCSWKIVEFEECQENKNGRLIISFPLLEYGLLLDLETRIKNDLCLIEKVTIKATKPTDYVTATKLDACAYAFQTFSGYISHELLKVKELKKLPLCLDLFNSFRRRVMETTNQVYTVLENSSTTIEGTLLTMRVLSSPLLICCDITLDLEEVLWKIQPRLVFKHRMGFLDETAVRQVLASSWKGPTPLVDFMKAVYKYILNIELPTKKVTKNPYLFFKRPTSHEIFGLNMKSLSQLL